MSLLSTAISNSTSRKRAKNIFLMIFLQFTFSSVSIWLGRLKLIGINFQISILVYTNQQKGFQAFHSISISLLSRTEMIVTTSYFKECSKMHQTTDAECNSSNQYLFTQAVCETLIIFRLVFQYDGRLLKFWISNESKFARWRPLQ